MVRSSRIAALTVALTVACAAPAAAAWFPAEAIDGPSAGILAFGGVDVARDGAGGLVYVKNDAGVPHVFLSRLLGGNWQAPERVDAGIEEPASQPVIAAADGNQLMIAWISAGRLFAAQAPVGINQLLSAPRMLAGDSARDPAVDLGINGVAYIVFTTDGGGGADVHAARILDPAWDVLAEPLDIQPADTAGDGARRARVAVSAEGYAVATWGERSADGRSHVYARRLTALAQSVAPQEVSLPDLGGAPGGDADSPDISSEDDGSFAWVVLRQDFGAVSRVIARRLVGSLFEAPAQLDSGSPAESPRVAINGDGIGLAALVQRDGGAVIGSTIVNDAFVAPDRWDATGSAGSPQPVVTAADSGDQSVAWLASGGGSAVVLGRRRIEEEPFEPQGQISNDAFGIAAPDGRLESAGDRLGDVAVGFLQGDGADRRIVAGVFDRPPGKSYGLSSTKPRDDPAPRLKWHAGADIWGEQTFKAIIDGVEVGQTKENSLVLTTALADGAHRWQVIGVDARGQQTLMNKRTLRIDTTPPRVKVTLSGRRRAPARIKVALKLTDYAGVRSVSLDYGDRSLPTTLLKSAHTYARPGRYTLTVRTRDKVGNSGVRRVKLRIKKR